MRICMLKQEELPKAIQLLWEVFAECTAPLYSPQGVEEFRSFIEIEHISKLYNQKQMFFWGAFENDELLGVSAVSTSGHISFLDVRPAHQNQGIENGLFQTMQQFCAQKLGNMRMNVRSAPNAVIKYQSLGFQISADEQQQNGVRYVPMEYIIQAADIKAEIKKSHIGLIGGIIVALVIMAIFVVVILSRAV
ncbi:MAG TPA: GNAT family N-acetyltransferase [Candidatus Pelethocola excrementipullorum]|nr:GNAT family N-acetyltransferase [Candidatus Pelethocola excrementipullorum]